MKPRSCGWCAIQNVVQLYGMLGSHEDQPDGSPTAYLALKREGPDLATLLNDPSHG